MLDCHVHLERGPYTVEWINCFVSEAIKKDIDEVFFVEHTHRFKEFLPLYEPMSAYSDTQSLWLSEKGGLSIAEYIDFINKIKRMSYSIKMKFGLEVCYEPIKENFLMEILPKYPMDFLVGSVHWVDGFAYDHKKEYWHDKDIDLTFTRYYEIVKELIKSELFDGLAHPDAIKCFGHSTSLDLHDTYVDIARLLVDKNMYAEDNAGLHINYNHNEIGLNKIMRDIFRAYGVRILTGSDAHIPMHVGENINILQNQLHSS